MKITTVTNNTEITEITDKEDWSCWRKNNKQEKPTQEINQEPNNSPKSKINITLKQATLTDLYNGQQHTKGKQEKIRKTSKETKQEKREITENAESQNTKPNKNNTNKKQPNNIGGKTRKQPVVLRKPVLPEPKNASNKKPTDEKHTPKTKITNYFTRNHQRIPPEQKPIPKLPELPEKEIRFTIKAKPPKPKKPKPDSSIRSKTKNSRDQKTKKAEQTKEKARGYWLKLAENQKIQKNRQQTPEKVKDPAQTPELQAKQQAYSISGSRTARFTDRNTDVLEPSRQLESNTQIKDKSEITLGDHNKLG